MLEKDLTGVGDLSAKLHAAGVQPDGGTALTPGLGQDLADRLLAQAPAAGRGPHAEGVHYQGPVPVGGDLPGDRGVFLRLGPAQDHAHRQAAVLQLEDIELAGLQRRPGGGPGGVDPELPGGPGAVVPFVGEQFGVAGLDGVQVGLGCLAKDHRRSLLFCISALMIAPAAGGRKARGEFSLSGCETGQIWYNRGRRV